MHHIPSSETDILALSQAVGKLLLDARLTLATAESCTGGLLGGALTEVSGASAYYLGGVVSYADDVKVRLLDVPPDTIRSHGAVSAQTAAQMAEGVARLLGSDVAISITGVAGPTGGSPEKPVGTTYIALAAQGSIKVEHF